MLKGPFTWSKQRAEDGRDDFRISDGYDNRIVSCYDQANAHWLTQALNDWWFWRLATVEYDRHKALDQLTAEAQAMGFYDPPKKKDANP